MSTLFFIVLQAHLNVRLVTIARSAERALDDPKIMERMLRAFRRGAALKVDLFEHWDYWRLMGEPIESVRASLGVPPPDPADA